MPSQIAHRARPLATDLLQVRNPQLVSSTGSPCPRRQPQHPLHSTTAGTPAPLMVAAAGLTVAAAFQPRGFRHRLSLAAHSSAVPTAATESEWAPLNGRNAVIVGAGPAGCTLAMYLARAGWRVRVYEKRPEPGPATTSRQRSWVLTMYPRGIRPVTAVAAEVPLLRQRAYKGLVIKPSKTDSKPIVLERTGVLMDRTLVATSLLDAARRLYGTRVEFTFSAPLERVDFSRKAATFKQSAAGDEAAALAATAAARDRTATDGGGGDALLEVSYDLLVGADGSSSKLRSLLAEAFPGQYDTKVLSSLSQSEQDSLSYKTVQGLPPLQEVERWDPDHAVPPSERVPGEFFFFLSGGAQGFMSFCRDIDGTYCGYLAAKTQVLRQQRSKEDYEALTPQCAPNLPSEWLTPLAERLLEAPLSTFPVMRSLSRFWAPGGVVLVGDAAHTVTPSLGQGLNSALEDCEWLAGELSKVGSGAGGEALDAALRRFSELRTPEVRALQELELLQSSSLTRLDWGSADPGLLLGLLARKWIIFQYSGLALLGTVVATAKSARRREQVQKQQQQQQHGQQQEPLSVDGDVGRGEGNSGAGGGSAAVAMSNEEADATAVADLLASQLDATYVRSPPMYELLRGHMGYQEMLVRVYGMAALGTGLTVGLLYGVGSALAALAARSVAG